MTSRTVKALVLSGYGINCEEETAAAWNLAGAQAEIVHVNSLLEGNHSLAAFDVFTFPGGFSFGDDLGSGKVLAHLFKHRKTRGGKTLLQEIQEFVNQGKLVLGICNGFQVLMQTGLLPGGRQGALTFNKSGKFEDRWVRTKVSPNTKTPFLKGLESLDLPVRHGEGRLVLESDSHWTEVLENGQAALFYTDDRYAPTEAYPNNPNGSPFGCAAMTSPCGRIFGLMPHPEAALTLWNHPSWSTLIHQNPAQSPCGDGLSVFQNAVSYFQQNTGAQS
jgi:phosphoribosylformylglycinamidine synthase I